MERVIRREAHAKINVYLRVLGRRTDGYHDIESLILPVSLADTLTVRLDAELRLSVKGDLADAVPVDETNLVIRAARSLAAATGVEAGADIELTKRIQVAAGLGGGSADAAAALRALNELWGCGLPDEALLEMGAAIGSDVPALLTGGPARIRGRGEIVEAATVESGWWVLMPLPFQISVADAYRWWDEDGSPRHPVTAHDSNDLQEPVTRRHPEIAEAIERLAAAGAGDVRMSGSGPTVVGAAESEEHAGEIADAVPGSIPVSAPP
jgi:4-diphosphocytidyl-2-C-methyl-D-erythritol kinase